MKNLEYRFTDKSDWGDGPWQNEPDKIQWLDEATGLPCLIVRGPQGSLCGYVGVSEGHPSFQSRISDVDVEVHGGLTFADFCSTDPRHEQGICHVVEPGENDRVWWLGFDCAHAWDLSPGMNARMRDIRLRIPDPHDRQEVYRDIEYVKQQTRELAAQLKNSVAHSPETR